MREKTSHEAKVVTLALEEKDAAVAFIGGLGGGLAAPYMAASLNWPIVIWYGEELTE